jgi:hypothetical protein
MIDSPGLTARAFFVAKYLCRFTWPFAGLSWGTPACEGRGFLFVILKYRGIFCCFLTTKLNRHKLASVLYYTLINNETRSFKNGYNDNSWH